jgi:hypothetical protein
VVLLLLAGSQLRAQAAATVPASSEIYDRLESVSALFPTRGVHLGQRSLSRRDLERAVARLAVAIDADSAAKGANRRAWARRELDAVAMALSVGRDATDGRLRAAGAWRAELFASDALSERIENNGMGQIDAVTHPFAARRDGWPTIDGTSTSVAPTGVLGFGNRLAVAVEPRLSLDSRDDSYSSAGAFFHRAYARGVLYNVAFQVGADELLWGQSPLGALFISGHAAPLRAVVIGTDTPITLPWLLRIAGPVRIVTLLADLGRSQNPPHAKLAGWQVTVQPWTRFELGVAVLAQQGGRGGPPASLFRRFVDLLPVIDALAPQHADLQFSNKLAGGNLRLRFPELSGLDFYYELQIDDFDARRLRSSFVDDAGHLLGARLPLLVGGGQLTWRAEWHRTSLRLYEHGQFRSGVTYRERLIGNPLGPNAKAGYLSAVWQSSPLNTFALTLADEWRDPTPYTVITTSPRDRGFRFIRGPDEPQYRRNRATASFERAIGGAAVRLALGYNRAWRTGQPARGEWLGLLTLRSQHLRGF